MPNSQQVETSPPGKLIVVIPVYDDWCSLSSFLAELDSEFHSEGITPDIFVVDDGSSLSWSESEFALSELKALRSVSVIELRRNLGHQRAIALGLTHIGSTLNFDHVLVIDGDGEDSPSDAVRLVRRCEAEGYKKLVFARRSKRSEPPVFRAFYAIYKIIYRVLTGRSIRFGNFSVVPAAIVKKLIVISEGWNHYAAAVLKARVPYVEVESTRGSRLDGKSKMNFVSLIIHGLSAISVFGDVVGIRLLLSTFFLIMLSAGLAVLAVLIRLFTDLAIPGWATYVVAFLVVILLQSLTLSLFFCFLVLMGRDNGTFIPERDYQYFIAGVYPVYSRQDTEA